MEDPRSRNGTLLGDYRLDFLLEDGADTLTWLAEQVSIRRPVVLLELKAGSMAYRDAFLEDVRAKAAVEEPLVGSVYEAVSNEEQCFVVMERLNGSTLADRAVAREALPPVVMAGMLAKLAQVMLKLEAAGIDTLPLELSSIHLDPQGAMRLANIASSGTRHANKAAEEVARAGKLFQRLVADGLPGASRISTLLSWMRGEGLEKPISWQEVADYGVQIEQQLTEGTAAAAEVAAAIPTKKRNRKLTQAIGGGVMLIAAAGAVVFSMRSGKQGPVTPLPGMVSISAGTHPTPDGAEEALPGFEISGHEVTIREYRDFLDALKRLREDLRSSYDADGQPSSKADHTPAGWEAMLAAARSGGTWEGLSMSLECPIVNIDWWDAAAFCKWRSARLPTQEEWFAALRTGVADPAKLTGGGWGPVQDTPESDRTPAGLYGMAGSVAEWTRDPAINPANPLGAKGHVIAGASYVRRGGGALAREWTQDLLLRRPDLGFRVVMDDR